MDGEFGHLCGELAGMGIALNEMSRDEHMGDIERFIQTIKEQGQSTILCHLIRFLQGWLLRWQRQACFG